MCHLKCKVQARRCCEGACVIIRLCVCVCMHKRMTDWASTWEMEWDAKYELQRWLSSWTHKHEHETQAPLFLFWLFSCRKCSPRLTKTNKYFIQCIMCAVWSTGERERGRPHEGICFEFLMTLLLTLLALSHREETHRDATPRSQTSTLILLFFPQPLLLSLPISLYPIDTRIEHAPPHKHIHTGKTQAQFWELTLAWGLFSVAALCQK